MLIERCGTISTVRINLEWSSSRAHWMIQNDCQRPYTDYKQCGTLTLTTRSYGERACAYTVLTQPLNGAWKIQMTTITKPRTKSMVKPAARANSN